MVDARRTQRRCPKSTRCGSIFQTTGRHYVYAVCVAIGEVPHAGIADVIGRRWNGRPREDKLPWHTTAIHLEPDSVP